MGRCKFKPRVESAVGVLGEKAKLYLCKLGNDGIFNIEDFLRLIVKAAQALCPREMTQTRVELTA